MAESITVGNLSVNIERKKLKNMYLNVYPPLGSVSVSAPVAARLESIRLFVISRLSWIRNKQSILTTQSRELEREYVSRESHYLWGRRYLFAVVDSDSAPSVELRHGKMTLYIRKGASKSDRAAALELWYRHQVKEQAAEFIEKWAPKLNVKIPKMFVQHMKTRWGSANKPNLSIRLNTELARKPRECLEYIVVHELAHLVVPDHSPAFFALMDKVMPNWTTLKNQLNRLPIKHEKWSY